MQNRTLIGRRSTPLHQHVGRCAQRNHLPISNRHPRRITSLKTDSTTDTHTKHCDHLPISNRHPRRTTTSLTTDTTTATPTTHTTARKHKNSPKSKLRGAHKPVGLVAGSSFIITAGLQASGVAAAPYWLTPVITGGALGAIYVILDRFSVRRIWRSPETPLNIVITGSSKGVGKALAREFLRCGDRVVVTSRSPTEAAAAAAELVRQTPGISPSSVIGVVCDVADAASVQSAAAAAVAHLGSIDVWVNNAGYSGSFKPFIEQSHEVIEQVVRTNLLGTLFCTRTAAAVMAQQPGGGVIFNTEGAGSDGSASPQYAAYGATKAAISQLCDTLQHEMAAMSCPASSSFEEHSSQTSSSFEKENKKKGNNNEEESGISGLRPSSSSSSSSQGHISIHNISPGMVLTDLLLEGATIENKRAFDVLCEHPETVAAFLVPRIRSTVACGCRSGQKIRFLTPLRAVGRFLAAPFLLGRFFDKNGDPIYAQEEERVMGQHAKRTERRAQRAARRSAGLGLAYGASLAAAYLILAVDQVFAHAAAGGSL